VRENGGQYTHGALWAAWAFSELGDGTRAAELFNLLNPVTHALDREDTSTYRVEPYVVAADIYGAPPYLGRGGWSWYTGSASWMYRLGTEAILGLKRAGATLRVDPCIPPEWDRYQILYRYGRTRYTITVENPVHVSRGIHKTILDGRVLQSNAIPLQDDGEPHEAVVQLG
jgi:cyclic beta-1,2-glucan synthetase